MKTILRFLEKVKKSFGKKYNEKIQNMKTLLPGCETTGKSQMNLLMSINSMFFQLQGLPEKEVNFLP